MRINYDLKDKTKKEEESSDYKNDNLMATYNVESAIIMIL